MPDFSVRLTHLHTVTTAGEEFVTLDQWSDLSVTRVINDTSTARVTISQYNDIAGDLNPFAFALKIYYGDELVFWAPANIEDNFDDGTCLISSGDLQQLEHHYARIGDEILTILDNDTGLRDTGYITPDWFGLNGLLICSYNTPEQDTDNWPPPGIVMGDNFATIDTNANIKIERGQEVLSAMKSMTEPIAGVDFLARPLDTSAPQYCQIDVYDQIFEDKSDDIHLAWGTTGDNLTGLSVSPLFPKTVVHVLDQPPLHRQTQVNTDAAEAIGSWVDWEATDIGVKDDDVQPLIDVGAAIAKVYGFPLKAVSATMRPDAAQTSFYGFTHDYVVGDILSVEGVRGNRSISGKHQITQVELTQQGWRGLPTTNLTLVPWVDV
jgi:hypothetical protein